ncbi:hypothetical protein ISCGN_009790 [Ixodes scapularis]
MRRTERHPSERLRESRDSRGTDATASADGEPRQYLREKTAAIACCVVCGGRSGIPARGSGSQGTQEERTPRRQLMREAPGVKGLKKDATASADGEPRQYLREKTAAIACCVVCGGRSGIPARGSGSQGTQEERTPRRQLMREAPGVKGLKKDATASADGEPRQYLREKTAAIACRVVCGGRSGIPARGSGSQGTQEERTPRRQLMREAPGVKGLKKDATTSADGEPRQYLREKTAARACCVLLRRTDGGSGSQGTQEERTPRRQLMREAPGVKGLKKDATASADGEPRQYLREKTAAIACCVVCGGRSGIPARGSGSQGTQEERTPRRQLMREAPGVKGLKKDATASADGEPRQYLREKTAAIACCVVCGGRSGIPARGSGSQGTQEGRHGVS